MEICMFHVKQSIEVKKQVERVDTTLYVQLAAQKTDIFFIAYCRWYSISLSLQIGNIYVSRET